MNYFWIHTLVFIICNLVGNLNFAIIFGKMFRQLDIRFHGSKNAGFTNAMRVMGKKIGWLVFAGDFLKGFLAVLIAWIFAITTGINNILLYYTAGLGVVLGHDFPIFFGWAGGKGLLTSFAVLLCLNPLLAAVSFIVWFGTIVLTNYVALGSVVCAAFYLLISILDVALHPSNIWIFIYSAIITLLIILRHSSNIQRLLNKTENKANWFRR